jgi:glycosyltransferase involved in cell wall biosynthesis
MGRDRLALLRMTQRLVRHWVPADITVATAWDTAFAGYALSDRSVTFYHMQHWEELFFQDELHRKLARLTYYLPLKLIANSTWLQREIRQRRGRDSLLLLPGVDTKTFRPRLRLEEKYASPGKIRVLCYYSPRDFKGWPDAVAAMEEVFVHLGSERLEWVVYGGLPVLAPEIPVTFVGPVFGEQLGELYSASHIVFMPSWYESFPLPPIEAMASGTATVVTGTGTEDYAVDGVNALVRSARQPHVLAQAIIALARDPAQAHRLAQQGLATAERFNWNKAGDCLEDILKSAMGADPEPASWRASGSSLSG